MSATTERPSAPDCDAFPRCGLEVTGACRCYPATTVPVPRPDPVRAWLTKHHAIAALRREQDALWDAMTPAERAVVKRVVGLATG